MIAYATSALGSCSCGKPPAMEFRTDRIAVFRTSGRVYKSYNKGKLSAAGGAIGMGKNISPIRYGLGDKSPMTLFQRDNVSGTRYAYDVYGANPQVYNIPKFYEHFVREDINANTGDAYNTIPLLTGEEALLNRAEAYLMRSNPNAAVQDLNVFISQNMDDYDHLKIKSHHRNAPTIMAQLYNRDLLAILDFKRAFFMHEGMRWFDIIRLRIPVTHTTADGEMIELTPNDNRRVLQLPALTKQAGLEPNPR